MHAATETECAHETCGCRPRAAFHPYCSEFCGNVVEQRDVESNEGENAGACSCRHPECTERLRARASDAGAQHPAADSGRSSASISIGRRGGET